MDIQKEREAFEATSPFSIYMNKVKRDGNKYTPIYYKDLDYAQIMSFGWLAWQAALAQAVPKGFVLVEKTKLMQIVGSAAIIEPITRGNPLMSKYKTELDFILSTVRAMIEAREQKG